MIVYLHPHFEYPGGATRFVLQTAAALADTGQEVAILASGHHRWPETAFPSLRFIWVDVPVSSSLAFWAFWPLWYSRVRRELNQLPITVLFPQVFPANFWAFIYRRQRHDIRCVWYCHEPSAFIHDRRVIDGIPGYKRYLAYVLQPLLARIDIRLARRADAIIANSSFTANRTRRIYGRCDAVIYPGVDVAAFSPASRKEPYFVSVGRLTKFKRFDLVLEALAILRKSDNVEVEYRIIGDGEERSVLEGNAKRLGLTNCVHFLGRLSDSEMADVVAAAQAVVVPATDEPFGLVPIEAMAAGTAVIASNSGGPMETVSDGVTGLLFQAGSAESLAHRLRQFMTGHDAYRMGLEARKFVVSGFTWAATAQALKECFAPVSPHGLDGADSDTPCDLSGGNPDCGIS